MSMVTGGMGSGGGAAIVASHMPLLSNGKLPYSGGNVVIVIVPSPQILPPGRGNRRVAAIDGHRHRCSSAKATITLTTTNASAVSSSFSALALLDSLKEAIGDKDAAVVAVGSHAFPPASSLTVMPTPCH